VTEFVFQAAVWVYEGDAPWHFVTLPRGVAAEIRRAVSGCRRPFGSVKVAATVGRTRWKTSLFPHKAGDSYLLPVKAAVRAREQIQAGMTVEVLVVVAEAGRGET
jgi:hypothetical protein